MTTIVHAQDLAPGTVLAGGQHAGHEVQHTEPADGCWLRVTVTTSNGAPARFQMGPSTPVEIT